MLQHSIADLNERCALPGQLEFVEAAAGMVVARIANAHAQADIALQGAHVMSWQPAGERAVIWMSPAARLVAGKSLRGGIPICWPWFGAHGSNPAFSAHGFARTVPWRVVASEALPDGGTRIIFELPQDSIPADQWPHRCQVRYSVTVGSTLDAELVTTNTGAAAFTLGQALHTYFAVGDIDEVSILGLEDCSYLDKVGPPATRTQHGPIRIASEVDRIYIGTEADCVIEDRGLGRRVRIAKSGSRSNVVWNPWIEKSARMGDFGSTSGYRGMVCVETANAADDVVTLAPGAVHSLRARYSIEKM